MKKYKVFAWINYAIMISVAMGCITFPSSVGSAFAEDFWQGTVNGNINTPENVRNVGIGTTAPLAKLHIVNGAFLIEGNQDDTSWLEQLGVGTRFMWIPSLSAFRAGTITSRGCKTENGAQVCNWDLPKIGVESLALGTNSLASGAAGIALGNSSVSEGDSSISIGVTSSATGLGGVAIGIGAKANGTHSTSIGIGTNSTKASSITIGSHIVNEYAQSLLVGFSSDQPILFSDSQGVIIKGLPHDGSPRHALAVHGSIKAEEVVVDTNWADYVFSDDYRLPPLDEVAAFVQKNKHLPEVPSEDQIKEQGLKMADMMAIQMKKIEELTLYAIALKKENDALKAEKAVMQDNQKRFQNNQQIFNQRLRAIESVLDKMSNR